VVIQDRAPRTSAPATTCAIQPELPPLAAEDLPDFVLVVEGSEPLRIFQDAREDLHDTAFLELEDGLTLDLKSVVFEAQRMRTPHGVSFSQADQWQAFARSDSSGSFFIAKLPQRLSASAEIRYRRAEFQLRTMRARGLPDL